MILQPKNRILVTGGAGFIGTNFIRYWLKNHPEDQIINLDALTYAGIRANLAEFESSTTYKFVQGNIKDVKLVDQLMQDVDIVVHFAAESHVDRSIADPDVFLSTNILGTHNLLKLALKNKIKHFHHISTDEVFGSLALSDQNKFNLNTAYAPRSPYAASKAASDHLVRAYGDTYALPYTITNCSNNYGPYQFPEKLFALTITNLIEGKKVPIYDNGAQVRDWLYVIDHCQAIEAVLQKGQIGQTYLIGGLSQDISNLEVVKLIIKLMNKSEDQIEFVADRPGHDQRYSIDWSDTQKMLGWQPSVSLAEGLKQTIDWYLNNQAWWQPLKQNQEKYFAKQYPTLT